MNVKSISIIMPMIFIPLSYAMYVLFDRNFEDTVISIIFWIGMLLIYISLNKEES
jgi:hypothetical protein